MAYFVGRIVFAFYGGLCNFDPRDTLRGLNLRNTPNKYVVFGERSEQKERRGCPRLPFWGL